MQERSLLGVERGNIEPVMDEDVQLDADSWSRAGSWNEAEPWIDEDPWIDNESWADADFGDGRTIERLVHSDRSWS